MKYSSFDTVIGELIVAERISDRQFVYARPETLEKYPDTYIPYDWKLVTYNPDSQTIASKGARLRVPTNPTKQETKGINGA